VPRKPTVTKGKFVAAYRKSTSVIALAKSLGISVPTVYKNINRFKLKNMKRARLDVTDAQIKEVAKTATNLNDIAAKLKMAPTTLSQRCYKLGISLKENKDAKEKQLAFSFIKEYWVRDISEIAKKNKIAPRHVRHIMEKFSLAFCQKYNMPPVRRLRDFKVVNEILNNKSLKDDAETLSEITGLPAASIRTYLKGKLKTKKAGK